MKKLLENFDKMQILIFARGVVAKNKHYYMIMLIFAYINAIYEHNGGFGANSYEPLGTFQIWEIYCQIFTDI